jgi:hypothetical protein
MKSRCQGYQGDFDTDMYSTTPENIRLVHDARDSSSGAARSQPRVLVIS